MLAKYFPVHALQEQNIRIVYFPSCERLFSFIKPGVALIPDGIRCKTDPGNMIRRAPHMIEVIPDFELPATETMETSVKQRREHLGEYL